jgi:hypothetical protein
MQITRGGLKDGGWRRRDGKCEWYYTNQYGDIVSVTA